MRAQSSIPLPRGARGDLIAPEISLCNSTPTQRCREASRFQALHARAPKAQVPNNHSFRRARFTPHWHATHPIQLRVRVCLWRIGGGWEADGRRLLPIAALAAGCHVPRDLARLSAGGPVIKTIESGRTGLETKRPHKWGPLGGYY
jgi:hypothetical protein